MNVIDNEQNVNCFETWSSEVLLSFDMEWLNLRKIKKKSAIYKAHFV